MAEEAAMTVMTTVIIDEAIVAWQQLLGISSY